MAMRSSVSVSRECLMSTSPTTVAADSQGNIMDLPGLTAVGRGGNVLSSLATANLIPLPAGSRLYLLPGRLALGLDNAGKLASADESYTAVAAFLPPGYLALALSAFDSAPKAPRLPLFCYAAVCWYRGKFHVPAVRVDDDPKHDPDSFDATVVNKNVKQWLRKFPRNRLVAHHGLVCVRQYGCPNAANLFLRRWEAPVAVSGHCNAACQGCISEQKTSCITSPQQRIGFVPTLDEIIEIAVPHLEAADRAMISFGQGCEGEPLLQGKLIAAAIREIRKRTSRGTLHLNTNGSLPAVVRQLVDAGLDSIRISLNSARPALYTAYYHCRSYTFDNVKETFRIARDARLWTSINYLTFPGVTDDQREVAALSALLTEMNPRMIQWRNLNIDPDWYMQTVKKACPGKPHPSGLPELLNTLHHQFPTLRFGYFNPPAQPY